ncbi:MAG: hypothetical protein HY897_09420 [Deltaproteobacteria bacterium]|nr:hypothetical protein [Deltaproteobacteria bacterium]
MKATAKRLLCVLVCAGALLSACGETGIAADGGPAAGAGTDARGPDAGGDKTDGGVDAAQADVWSFDAGGVWLAGDMHVHATGASHDTDDLSHPADIKRVALERGLQFVVLTDHSDATGCAKGKIAPECMNVGPEFPYWDEAAALSEPGVFLMADGNEVSPIQAEKKGDPGYPPNEPRGHLGCVPKDLKTFGGTAPGFAFVDRPVGEVSGGQNVQVIHDIGGLAVVHHPFNIAVWTEYDWTSMEYDAIEIWNGGLRFDDGDLDGMNAWLCDWSQGKKTVPTGSSDCHRVGTPLESDDLMDVALGQARTSVYARDFTWPGVIEGLNAGHVAVHDFDNMIELWALDEAGEFLGMPGDEIDLPAGETIRFVIRGHQRRGASVLLSAVRPGSCEDHREQGGTTPPSIEITDVFENDDQLWSRKAFDYHFEVDVPIEDDGIVFARTWRKLDSSLNNDLAITNCLSIRAR